jgi:glycerophosphoryl diester phosphodiesterase
MNQPQVVAHRGSSSRHAENGWGAFKAAVVEGADGIECDVQGTRDGVLVIRHDLGIGNRPVADMSAAELDRLEPGLVRLADLIAWAPGARIGLLVEVKDPDIATQVGDMVAASPWCGRIVVGGFHGPALAAVKARTPDVRTSLMMGSVVVPEDLVRLARVYRADGVHPCWEARSPHPHRLLDATAIALFRGARLAVTLWNEERESELRALVGLRPDAICTDSPATLRRLVDAQAAATSEEGATRE